MFIKEKFFDNQYVDIWPVINHTKWDALCFFTNFYWHVVQSSFIPYLTTYLNKDIAFFSFMIFFLASISCFSCGGLANLKYLDLCLAATP